LKLQILTPTPRVNCLLYIKDRALLAGFRPAAGFGWRAETETL
jgi:hypothetical protein